MRLIRSLFALALLKAGFWLLDAAFWLRWQGVDKQAAVLPKGPLRPVERMLLGSIVGLAICTVWIWISARAGR